MIGPRGDFVLDEASRRTLVFIGQGVGFAPLRSLVEHALNLELEQPMRLEREHDGPGEPYLHNLCRSWADGLDDFVYVARRAPLAAADWLRILADPGAGDGAGSAGSDYYVSGPEPFATRVEEALSALGVPAERVRVNALERARR